VKTKNIAVGVLAALLTTALWYTFLLKPTRAQTSKVKADTVAERAKLEPLQAQLAQAQRDASHAAEFKTELASLQLAMPDSPALSAFIRDANGIAAASGVQWQSVTHATPTPGTGGVMSITVGITIKGTYPQVIDYLGRLAGLQRLVVVDSVNFAAAGAAATGAGAGSGTGSSGGSTGPFSGASSLTVTISARMFETPGPAVGAAGTGVSTVGAPASAPSSQPAGLNNS
jgi:Tfp pilus assembly protein PilO